MTVAVAGPPACVPAAVDPAAVPHAAASSPAATGTPSFTGIGSRPSMDMPILIISCSGRWTLVRQAPPLHHLLAGTEYGQGAGRDWTVTVTCVTTLGSWLLCRGPGAPAGPRQIRSAGAPVPPRDPRQPAG